MPPRQPPVGAPEGTVWFGGPIDRCHVTLRIMGEELDPNAVTELLRCSPTCAQKKGDVFFGRDGSERMPKRGYWALELNSPQTGDWDVEHLIVELLASLPADPEVWDALGRMAKVDLYCGLFMESTNRGFGLSASTCQMIADRQIEIGFDIYARL